MLRITVVSENKKTVHMRLEGWLAGENVAFLANEAQAYRRSQQRLVLDLSGVKHIDSVGLVLLAAWSGPRLELRGASAYLRSLLAAEGLGRAL